MTAIHPTAVVDPGLAGPGVRVGPSRSSVRVCLGEEVEIGPHVAGGGSSWGAMPDLRGRGDWSPAAGFKWIPDARSGIGEGPWYASTQRSTGDDAGRLDGDRQGCYLMAQGHIAHDCQIGDSGS
jgi:acyl-[acyl carrier protein]--UDP-N-acetylglucosamine O-acyltransferase